MSFEIFLQRFRNGNTANFPRKYIEVAFEKNILTHEPDFCCISLVYSNDYGGEIYVSNNEQIDGFSVNRPGKNPAFWSSIYEIMCKAELVLYWPGDSSMVVTEATLSEHIPPDMLTTLGPPRLVNSGAEIIEKIEHL